MNDEIKAYLLLQHLLWFDKVFKQQKWFVEIHLSGALF